MDDCVSGTILASRFIRKALQLFNLFCPLHDFIIELADFIYAETRHSYTSFQHYYLWENPHQSKVSTMGPRLISKIGGFFLLSRFLRGFFSFGFGGSSILLFNTDLLCEQRRSEVERLYY